MTTALDLTRRALAEIGTRTTISSMNDGSTEANYASLLYAPLRDFMLREGDYDWAMKQATVLVGPAAVIPWLFLYVYPADAIRIRQLIPATYDYLDPQPVEWNIYTAAAIRYIATRTAVSEILYTYAPVEDLFDAMFQEAFVRMLASGLAFALENRIEASDKALKEAISFSGIANLRDS